MMPRGPGARPGFRPAPWPKIVPKFCGILSAAEDNDGMMRTRKLALALASGAAVALAVVTSGASALAGTGSPWGTAIEVPGIAALDGNFSNLRSRSWPAGGE